MELQADQCVYNTEARLVRPPTMDMVKNVPNPKLSYETYMRYIKQYQLVCDAEQGTRVWVQFYVGTSDCVAVLVETPHNHNQLLNFPRAMLDFIAPPGANTVPCTASG